MARLIDADALIEGITLWYENIDTINSPTDAIVHNVLSSVMDDINDCETIDAEPVVRCKDCKYARPYDCKYVTCLCHPTFIHYSPVDGYCYLGKKVDGGAEDG